MYSSKLHLSKCLDDSTYDGGWANYRLARLYDDFDPFAADLTELRFHLKWKRPLDAVAVLERIVKSQPPDSAWEMIHELFKEAVESSNSDERFLFAALPTDVFECVISGLTKRYDSDDILKTKMLVFALQVFDNGKLGKLLNRAVTFLTERANNDKENLLNGIGKYHVYVALVAVPALLKMNFTNITPSRALNVINILLHVVIAWPKQYDHWANFLRAPANSCAGDDRRFGRIDFATVAVLLDRCIDLYDFGMPVHFYTSASCGSLLGCVDKAASLKSEARKIAFAFLIWYAYRSWKNHTANGEALGWIPEDNWAMEVDKLLSDKGDAPGPNKKPRLKEKREQLAASQSEHLVSTRRELCEAYELCYATLNAFSESVPLLSITDNLQCVAFFSDVQRFIGETLLFKFRLSDAITLMNERVKNDDLDTVEREVLHFQLACANCLEKNWPAACECVTAVFFEAGNEVQQLSAKEGIWAAEQDDLELRPMFKLLKRDELWHANYDLAYHILFRVYTSTAVDHDNDQLLGALLVLTQVDWAGKGYQCFNRILRHIEAKGSLKSAGLVKHITNTAIVEELYRIHVYCAEYVSIQIAPPQVQRRIGQATRHSIMGTKDGQKQALEEQIRCCSQNPYVTVSSFFLENKESVMKMLGSK